jgi:hypothetical protein
MTRSVIAYQPKTWEEYQTANNNGGTAKPAELIKAEEAEI